jgi:hypothetical protein
MKTRFKIERLSPIKLFAGSQVMNNSNESFSAVCCQRVLPRAHRTTAGSQSELFSPRPGLHGNASFTSHLNLPRTTFPKREAIICW